MTFPQATISVKVEPTNPGQFFACCGLLELADRLWPGAEGWFNVGEFHISGSGSLKETLEVLVKDLPLEVLRLESNGLEVRPLFASLAFKFGEEHRLHLTLDAWNRIAILKGITQVISNSPWNFWSGQQTALGIWSGLRNELLKQMKDFTADQYKMLFTKRLFQKGRFGFDPGPAWNPIDVGFSPNEQGIEVESSAAVELLAAVGLQRFRPHVNKDRDGFDYFTWHYPYAPPIAAAAMAGEVRNKYSVRYRASVIDRGQYAALSFSYPIRQGVSDE